MSISQPDRAATRLARASDPRNGYRAAAPELSPSEFDRRPRAVPDLPQKSVGDREWGDRVAREVRHQEVIEASFDRAEAYARLRDFEQALKWLDRAATLSGGLPPAYRAQRARWALTAAIRPTPTGRDRTIRLVGTGGGAGR